MTKAKLNYLNSRGEIESLSFKELKEKTGNKQVSWDWLHMQDTNGVTKETAEFLKRFGQKLTVFNVSVFEKIRYLPLYDYDLNIALEKGAKDKREIWK